ncbi:hypothetical protein ASPZODRAFT_136400 [Penicilliopsis zonata CBS 506.65]|uniref:NAD-dependent 15-hydroxyprostaglandin dehydrogenase n=1 Tax=Penicilliopsis zonata CBS 506.65 TaxID=1073090 RepID=A0A1L9S7R4_9EURO|nr:hypothetical protein ASPZODRAFT_136400 [Penicilliopsis zonata CBS 506.65]OJJ43201.1 hypothetical protein ASPZODRAFT_136400 [Penicilliopsis zonata CBS 506.65]
MASSVKGKTAIVTGAGSGINLCFAQALLENGCNVVIADLALRPEAQAVYDTFTTSPKAVFVKTDVADWSQLEQLFTIAEKEFGEVGIVCPGAGIFEPNHSAFWFPPGSAPSTDTTASSRYATLDINLVHPIRMSQMAITHFLKHRRPEDKEQKKKHILLVSSIAGHMPLFVGPLYSITKHGISALVQSLAPLDHSLGIRVVGIAPGITRTPIWLEHPDKMALLDEQVDEWVLPEDVATMMLALVSQEKVGEAVGETDQEKLTIPVAGGTILEVSKTVRAVSVFNDPGPIGRAGNTVTNFNDVQDMILQMLGTS